MKPDTEGNLIPAVAESCTVNETADVYTYTLREGVKFHNGADVTVGDVVYSLTRAAGLETGEPLVGEVKGIASVEAVGDRTVVVTLKAPDAEFNAYMSVAIIPQGIDPNDSPVGTGPFRFVSHTAQDSVVLEKFDEYWGQGAYLDKVTLKVIPDPQTLVMSLRSGAIDLACHLDATQIANMADMTVMEGSSNVIQALYLNHDFAPFADERVRQALCYAVDKQAVIDLAMDSHGTPVGTSMLSTLGRYAMPELADYYQPDVDKAKALLKEAGYENLSFTITVPSNYASHVGTAQVLVEQLKAAGVDAKIDLVDWNTWLTETYQGRNPVPERERQEFHQLQECRLRRGLRRRRVQPERRRADGPVQAVRDHPHGDRRQRVSPGYVHLRRDAAGRGRLRVLSRAVHHGPGHAVSHWIKSYNGGGAKSPRPSRPTVTWRPLWERLQKKQALYC